MARRAFWPQVTRILRLAERPVWAGSTIIGLGLFAAALEGISLVLFIPLLQSLGAPVTRGSMMQDVIDKLITSLPSSQVTGVLVGVLCLSIILKSLVGILGMWVTRYAAGQVAHRLRTRIFNQVLSACVDYRTGMRRADIATTLSTNSWRVSDGFILISRLIISLLTFVFFAILMIGISWALTMFALLCLAVTAVVIRFSTRQADATGQAVVAENKEFGLRMWESIESLQLIRAFGREAFERDRFQASSDRVRRRLLKLDLLWALPSPISEVAIVLLIGVLVLAAHSIGLGIATLVAFLSLLYRMQAPIRELMQAQVALDGFAGSVDDVDRLLAASQTPYLGEGTRCATPLVQSIDLTDVWFRYDDDRPWALEGVSFSIPAGKTTAIIGESGAGKSTLLSLLFRFQDPTHGQVAADGVTLPSFTLASWRHQIAIMSQDVQLFADTIAANIAYGRPNAKIDEIVAAAAVAHADKFIDNLPERYETVVGDRGLRLSGGQRQRIALARTVLLNPDILLLDEATNALDVEAEQAFQLALERYAHQRTVVVVAHRLTTIQNADFVVVLSKGRVIEFGSPAELLRTNGSFARMLQFQQRTTSMTSEVA